MLQYAVDCRLDELLSTVYSTATEPPLTQSPFAHILPVVRAHACKMHLWKEDSPSLQDKMMNQLSRIGPSDCFMYSGVLSPALPAISKFSLRETQKIVLNIQNFSIYAGITGFALFMNSALPNSSLLFSHERNERSMYSSGNGGGRHSGLFVQPRQVKHASSGGDRSQRRLCSSLHHASGPT